MTLLDRHGASALLVLTWGWVLSAPALSTALSPKSRQGVGESAQAGGSAIIGLTSLGLAIAVLGLCAVLVAGGQLARPGVWRLMLLLSPWAYLLVREVATGATPDLRMLMFAAVITALWAARAGHQQFVVLGWLVVLTAAVSIALGTMAPSVALFHNDAGLVRPAKALLPGGLLVGLFSHPNTLGQFLALGLPAVTVIERAAARWAGVAVVLVALVWTGSRTSMLAAVVAAAVAAGIGLTPHALRSAASALSLGALSLLALLAPYVVSDPAAFTNRGYIWRSSLRRAGEEMWVGLGPGWYGDVGQTVLGLGPTVYHAHNQVIHSRVVGGLIAVALLFVVWAVAAVAAGRIARRRSLVAVGYLAALITVSWFEVPLGFVDKTLMTPVVAAPLALVLFDPAGFPHSGNSRTPRDARKSVSAIGTSA